MRKKYFLVIETTTQHFVHLIFHGMEIVDLVHFLHWFSRFPFFSLHVNTRLLICQPSRFPWKLGGTKNFHWNFIMILAKLNQQSWYKHFISICNSYYFSNLLYQWYKFGNNLSYKLILQFSKNMTFWAPCLMFSCPLVSISVSYLLEGGAVTVKVNVGVFNCAQMCTWKNAWFFMSK